MQQPEYVAVRLDELTSMQQLLSIADSEMERLTADNARYLLALRSLATWAEDAIKGGSKVVVREQPRWIPVGEKLPDEGKPVLINFDDGHVTIGKYYGADFEWCASKMSNVPVTHWMPLPEPPDGQS